MPTTSAGIFRKSMERNQIFWLYCEEVGVENYRVLLSKLEAENRGKVAESAAPYFVSRAEKVTQRRLFD